MTNIDAKDSEIVFTVETANWILVSNATEKIARSFTQQVGIKLLDVPLVISS